MCWLFRRREGNIARFLYYDRNAIVSLSTDLTQNKENAAIIAVATILRGIRAEPEDVA